MGCDKKKVPCLASLVLFFQMRLSEYLSYLIVFNTLEGGGRRERNFDDSFLLFFCLMRMRTMMMVLDGDEDDDDGA